MKKKPKVVVIGAGLAGLSAGYRLHKQGIDVHVYEARGRVGGRVFSVNIDGTIGELGAQNITDGGKSENILRLISEFDLEVSKDKIGLNVSYFSKQRIFRKEELWKNFNFEAKELKAQLDKIARTSRNMKDVLDQILPKKGLLYQMMAVRLSAYEGGRIENLSPVYAETLYYMLLGGVSAAHSEFTGGSVEVMGIEGGNSKLAEKLEGALQGRVHLNHPLTKVSKDENGTFILTFRGGLRILADQLVLAVPCTVYDAICFDEKVLGKTHLETIKKIQYGENSKVLFPFSDSPGPISGICNERAVSFYLDNMITLYYSGDTSAFCKNTILESCKKDHMMLEKHYGDRCAFSKKPTLALDKAFSCYDQPVGHSWPNDPYAKGSYSYIATGQEEVLTKMHEEGGEGVKSLFAPINGLYFAGEHTSILSDAPGTMEAACESGERTARMILRNR